MRKLILSAAFTPLLLTSAALACSAHVEARRGAVVVADNAATSTPAPASGAATPTDSTAFPNSPNGSPAATNKGAPVVTDKAACSGGAGAACADSPAPSGKADTSDTKIATPTTVNGSAPK